VLLFLSFQATSSNIKIVSTGDKRTALCVNGRGLFVIHEDGGMDMGTACPEWENARPAAVVNVEKPFWVTLGFIIISLGFLLQYLAVPDPRTIEQLRTELKAVRKQTARRKH
jgi:hypothetical protein